MKKIYQELDKYYTNEDTVKKCLAELFDQIKTYDYIIEPSAGNGAFLKKIKHNNKIGIDIQPEDKDIIKYNWLKFKIELQYKKVLVIGNPPFGKNHSLSDAFLKHAFSFSNVYTIAFVLPNTYNKYNRQKIIPTNWRIKQVIDLGQKCFTFNDETRHSPCSFFIIDKSKGKDLRVNPKEIKTNDFIFSEPSDSDFFIFGAAPHKVIKRPLANNRGYFIKSIIGKKELIRRFQTIKWKGNSCANGGVAWFTKLEIIQQYNNVYLHKIMA